jgi:tetratricopeptide (TPR) repeat protein
VLKKRNPTMRGIGLGVIAYGVQQLFLFPLAELDPIWWLLGGVVVAATSTTDQLDEVHRRLVPVLAGLLGVVMLVAGVLDVAADRLARTALRSSDHDAAIRTAERAVSLRPDNIRYRLVAAEVHLEKGTVADIDRAIAAARWATDWSNDDPFVGEELAAALSRRAAVTGNSDDIARALGEWQHLADRDPHRTSWQLQLGQAAALAGDVATAREAWSAAADLGEPGAAALLAALDASP